jgi:hypothetical protein
MVPDAPCGAGGRIGIGKTDHLTTQLTLSELESQVVEVGEIAALIQIGSGAPDRCFRGGGGGAEICLRPGASLPGDNPNAFFKGSCCQSFPSGEVTLQAAFVTPLIINYYKDTRWIWGLAAPRIYDAIARLKSQGHWQSDVIAGGLI